MRQQFRSLNYDPNTLFVADITRVERDDSVLIRISFLNDCDGSCGFIRLVSAQFLNSYVLSGVTPFWWSFRSIFGEIVVTRLKRARHHFSKRSAARPSSVSGSMSLVAKAASTSKS